MMQDRTRHRIETVIVAAAGAALFRLAGLPLPFLFGPMTACLIAALVKRPLVGLGTISVAARTILGVAVGASITPHVIGQLPQMAASVALMPVYIAVIAIIGVPFFHRVCGFDKATAYYAAMPGGLQDMVIFGTEAGGDGRALSLIHATRVLIVVTVAPIIIVYGFGAALAHPIGEPAADLPIHEMVMMVLAALVGWKGGEKIGLFGASILGPMIVTAALSLAGFIHHRPPAEAILTAQFLIGLGIGVGYVGVTLVEIRKIVISGVAFVLILALLALIFTEVVVQTGLAKPLEGRPDGLRRPRRADLGRAEPRRERTPGTGRRRRGRSRLSAS
jgi:membrane AbrB-like protein